MQNLERACRNNLQKSKLDPKTNYCPHTMTLEIASNRVVACLKELDRLRQEAPFLRAEHLQDMLGKARRDGDKCKEKALLAMLRKEYTRK